jgi:DNA adenine methylase
MKFMGSKTRIAKYILPIMLKDRKDGQWWVEPFVGGGNIIDKVSGNRIGADIDYWVIQALISIRDNVDKLPKNNKEFTEEDYENLRKGEYKFKGYTGYAFSWGAKWLSGWRRSKSRDYVAEAYRNALKQSINLQGVKLVHSNYLDLAIPPNSIIYCDPPYQNTTQYFYKINHQEFWEWCRIKASKGHKVYISEYAAPDDFRCIWKDSIKTYIRDKKDNTRIEKLFVYNGG